MSMIREAARIAMQDEKDGRALRELREALPPGRYLKCEWDPDDSPDMTVWYVATWDMTGDGPIAFGHGDTIAEAADACRAALEAP